MPSAPPSGAAARPASGDGSAAGAASCAQHQSTCAIAVYILHLAVAVNGLHPCPAVPCLPVRNVILRRSTAEQPLQPTNLQHTAVTAAGLEKLAFIADEMAGGAWHTKQSRAHHSRHCHAGGPSGAACAKWSQLPLAGLHAVAPVLLLPRGCRCNQSRQTGWLALRSDLRSGLLGGLLLLLLVLEAAGGGKK